MNLTEPPADITSSTTPDQPEPPSELPIRDPPEPDPPEHSDRGNNPSPATNIPESAVKVYPLRQHPKPVNTYEPTWT